MQKILGLVKKMVTELPMEYGMKEVIKIMLQEYMNIMEVIGKKRMK